MKSLTASDRKSLIRLAASLPKGDKSRRAILAGLKQVKVAASDTLVLEGLSPEAISELSDAYNRSSSKFMDMYFWGDNEIKIGDETFTEVSDYLPGFGITGALLPLLSRGVQKEVEDAIKRAGSSVVDTRKAVESFDEDADDAGGWRWEDETATWETSFRMVGGKVVNGMAISEMLLRDY